MFGNYGVMTLARESMHVANDNVIIGIQITFDILDLRVFFFFDYFNTYLFCHFYQIFFHGADTGLGLA